MVEFVWKLVGRLQRFIQYSLVGMVGVAINFTTLWLLTDKVGLWYLLSATIAIFLAATNNFVLNYYWTFKDRKKQISNVVVAWLQFLLSIGVTELLYLGLIYLFTDKAGLYYILSAFLALSCTTVIRYLTADRWIWRKKKAKKVRLVDGEKFEKVL